MARWILLSVFLVCTPLITLKFCDQKSTGVHYSYRLFFGYIILSYITSVWILEPGSVYSAVYAYRSSFFALLVTVGAVILRDFRELRTGLAVLCLFNTVFTVFSEFKTTEQGLFYNVGMNGLLNAVTFPFLWEFVRKRVKIDKIGKFLIVITIIGVIYYTAFYKPQGSMPIVAWSVCISVLFFDRIKETFSRLGVSFVIMTFIFFPFGRGCAIPRPF